MNDFTTHVMNPLRNLRRWTFVLLLVAVVVFPVPYVTAAGFAQGTVSISVKDAPVREVLKALEDQTEFTFLYSVDLFAKNEKVTLNVRNESFFALLENLLSPRGLTYKVDDKVVIISSQSPASVVVPREVHIRGTVKDASGEPLPGVSVVLKGVGSGTITDRHGDYTFRFTAVQGQTVLVFSYIGMKTQEITYAGQTEINVVLQEDVKNVEAVVVTGYQDIPVHQMVGSYETLSRENLHYDGTQTIEQMLKGQVAGLQVHSGSGLVGSRQKVRLRGTSTLLGNASPVWVVDGIIQEDPIPFSTQDLDGLGPISPDNFDMITSFVGSAIDWLNPNDIKDITVLKDAQATVLYGTKAANGVIVITTKRGEQGGFSVNYSGNVSFSPRPQYSQYKLMNSKERIDVSREIYQKGLISTVNLADIGYEGYLKQYLNKEITYQQFNDGVKYLEALNTDWLGILGRTPISNNHTVSISGGNTRVTYYASVGANFTRGNMKGNEKDGYTATLNMTAKITPKLDVDVRVSGSMSETSAFYGVDPYRYAITTSRALPAYEENGDYFFYSNNRTGSLHQKYNVLHELDNTMNTNNSLSFNTSINLRYEPIEGLRFSSRFGLNSSKVDGYSYATEHSYKITSTRGYEYGEYLPGEAKYEQSSLPHGGEYNSTQTKNLNYTWTNQIDLNRIFNDVHHLGATVSFDINSTKYDGFNNTIYGYMHERGRKFVNPPLTISSAGTVINNPIYDQMTKRLTDQLTNKIGLLASLSYSYDDRYIVTAGMRSDASNRFGQYTRYRFLPVWSFGGRWNVTNERWMQNQGVFSNLNFTLSYGLQGNIVETASPDLIARTPDGNPINFLTGDYTAVIVTLPYADLRWEKTYNFKIAMGASLFQNRVILSVEYYNKKTKDLIQEYPLPYEFGIASMPINGGDMTNQGWEFSTSFSPVRTDDFMWSLSLKTGFNKNKIEDTPSQTETWSYATSGNLVKAGYGYSSFWMFDFTGVDPETGRPTFNIPEELYDVEGEVDPTLYMKYAGVRDPKFNAGLSTVFRYKTWSLNASFSLETGHHKFMYPLYDGSSSSGGNINLYRNSPYAYDNLNSALVNRWRQPGDITDIPMIPYRGTNLITDIPGGTTAYVLNMYDYSSARLVNASNLRCSHISLSYSIPPRILERFKMQNISFSLSVTNPFYIASKKFEGMDPATGGNTPLMRTWSLGVNLGF